MERNAMTRLRRQFRHLAAVTVLGLLSIEAQAQSGRTVRVIVPTPPAGVNDLMARLLADHLGRTQGFDRGRKPGGRGRSDWHRDRGARRTRRQYAAVRVVA